MYIRAHAWDEIICNEYILNRLNFSTIYGICNTATSIDVGLKGEVCP